MAEKDFSEVFISLRSILTPYAPQMEVIADAGSRVWPADALAKTEGRIPGVLRWGQGRQALRQLSPHAGVRVP